MCLCLECDPPRACVGKGTLTYADGRSYVGDWVNGRMEGEGVETWPDGANYVGSFANNRRNGHGKMTYSEDDIEEGTWLNDEFCPE
eukprot:m.421790 g.421790  ORF g.421790 m.421790 type:complete len:86 (-) comp21320_c0_seq16:325-582(-)